MDDVIRKKPDPGHNQQSGDKYQFLRPDLDEEKVKPRIGHVHQHRLVRSVWPPVPAYPWRDVVDAERDDHHPPLQAAKRTPNPLWEYLNPRLIEAALFLAG